MFSTSIRGHVAFIAIIFMQLFMDRTVECMFSRHQPNKDGLVPPPMGLAPLPDNGQVAPYAPGMMPPYNPGYVPEPVGIVKSKQIHRYYTTGEMFRGIGRRLWNKIPKEINIATKYGQFHLGFGHPVNRMKEGSASIDYYSDGYLKKLHGIKH